MKPSEVRWNWYGGSKHSGITDLYQFCCQRASSSGVNCSQISPPHMMFWNSDCSLGGQRTEVYNIKFFLYIFSKKSLKYKVFPLYFFQELNSKLSQLERVRFSQDFRFFSIFFFDFFFDFYFFGHFWRNNDFFMIFLCPKIEKLPKK